MRRLLTLAILLLMTVPLAATGASESVTESYITGGPVVLDLGLAFTAERWDWTGDGKDDYPNIGGAAFKTVGDYRNAAVSVDDDHWGDGAAFQACFWSHDGSTVQETHCTPVGCGTQKLEGSPHAGGRLKVSVFALAVTHDLAVCGASTGTLTADFY